MSKIRVNQINPFSSSGIGIGSVPTDSSAILELNTTSAGFKPPRLTTEQRNAIASPGTGIVIFNTDLKRLELFDGVSWGTAGKPKTSNILYVDKEGNGDFSSISSAVDSITGASASNPYLIYISPGIYTEPLLPIPQYVSLQGTGNSFDTIIQPDTDSHHVIEVQDNVDISFLKITGAGPGYAGIHVIDALNFSLFHKVSIYDSDIGMLCEAIGNNCNPFLEYVDFDNVYSFGMKVISSNGYICDCNAENFYFYPSSNSSVDLTIDGPNSTMTIQAFGFQSTGSFNNGIVVTNGGFLSLSAGYFQNYAVAIHSDTNGTNPNFGISSVNFINCTQNLNIENSTATGFLTGYSEKLKTYINPSCSFFIRNKDSHIITVAGAGGDFTSVAAALNYITDASSTNMYDIQIGPGVFTEPQIQLKANVFIYGSGDVSTTLMPSNPNQAFILGVSGTSISNLCIKGATGTNGVGIYLGTATISNDNLRLRNIWFGDNTTLISLQGTQAGLTAIDFFAIHSVVGASFTNGILVYGVDSSHLGIFQGIDLNLNQSFATTNATSQVQAKGPGCVCTLTNSFFIGNPASVTATGIEVQDGANLRTESCEFTYLNNGILVSNIGSAPLLNISNFINISNNHDIVVDHPTTSGSVNGSFQTSNSSIASPNVSVVCDDPLYGVTITGNLSLGTTFANRLAVSDLILRGSSMGLYYGGTLSLDSGLVINILEGNGYAEDSSDIAHNVSWITQTKTLPANTSSYIYFDSSSTLIVSPNLPQFSRGVVLGRVVTGSSSVLFIDLSPVIAEHMSRRLDIFNRLALGPVYSSGSLVIEHGTRGLTVGSGSYFFSENNFLPSGGTGVSWKAFYKNGSGGYTVADQSAVDNAYYDAGTGTLVAIPSTKFVRHSLYIVGDGPNELYMLVYGQTYYDSQLLAEGGNISTPPAYFTDSVALIASIIVQQGQTNIIEIRDERPVLGFKASGVSASAYHSSLLGLSNDDHPQYLLTNGGRALTGDQSFGGKNITNLGTANGVTIEAHEARHLPNGADPLTTAAPLSNLTSSTTNSIGTANSLTRSDHSHAISTGTPSTLTPDQSNSAGSSANLAKADHIHTIATATPVSVGVANAQGSATSFSRSDHVHQVLTGNGITQSGSTIVPSYGTPVAQYADQTNSQGSTNTVADAAHIHQIITAIASSIAPNQTNARGTSTSFSRADHIHNIATGVPSTLNATNSNTQGTASAFAQQDHLHAISTGTPSTLTPDQSNSAGSSANLAKADHIHTIATATPVSVGSSNQQGTSTSFSRSDHVHSAGTGVQVVSPSLDSVPQYDGSSTWNPVYPESLINPSRCTYLFDDFIQTDMQTSVGPICGSAGWYITNTNGNPALSAGIAAIDNRHPGIVQLSTGTNSNGNCSLNLQTNAFLLGGGIINIESVVYFPTISASGQDYWFRVGFGDGNSTAGATLINNGVYLQYRRSVGGNFWQYSTINGGTATVNTSSSAVAATTWYRVGFQINAAASSVTFYVNGTSIGTITTNIPTANDVSPMIIMSKDNSGVTARTAYVDYYNLTQRFTTAR